MASAFAVLRENVEKGGKMKILFDSHAHLNNDTFSEEERESLIDDIEASDVAYMMDVGFDLPSSLQAMITEVSSITPMVLSMASRIW